MRLQIQDFLDSFPVKNVVAPFNPFFKGQASQ